MFKIIEPKYHCFHTSLIERFIESIKSYPSLGLDLSEPFQNGTTFILDEDKEKGIYGGAMLFKKKLCDFPQELIEILSSFISLKDPIWKCIISLSFENNSPLCATGEAEAFCQTFYRHLYDSLVKFGKKEKIGFLGVALDPGEYLCTEGSVFWPYVFELKPQRSFDGFFYGILPLKGSQYEAYKKVWQALDFSSDERKLAG